MQSLDEIQREVARRSQQISAPAEYWPTFGRSADGGRPHVEIDARGYHLITVERGQELQRLTTDDVDELLYFMFESITFAMANRDAALRGATDSNYRRTLFQRQIELLTTLSPAWAAREAAEHAEILKRHPYKNSDDPPPPPTATPGAAESDFRIWPKFPDVMVYEESPQRVLWFDSVSLDNPPRVNVPADDVWMARTPDWAHDRRALIVGRLRAARCVVFEVGQTETRVLSPDDSFQIDCSRGDDEKFGPWVLTQLLGLPSKVALASISGWQIVDAAEFVEAGRVTLTLVAGNAMRSLRVDLLKRTFQLPPGSADRPLDEVQMALNRTLSSTPATRGSRALPLRRSSLVGDFAMTAAGGLFVLGGVWLAFTGRTTHDRIMGAAGALFFGACAATGLGGLARTRRQSVRLAAAGVRLPLWMRSLPYAPLLAFVSEGPWIVLCVAMLMFLVGDSHSNSTPEKARLFQCAVSLPTLLGLLLAAIAAFGGFVRTPRQWIALGIGSLLCVGFLSAVAAGWVR